MIKFCAISDLHGTLPVIGQCDVVCICGDIFPLEIQRINTECEYWFNTEFTDWVDSLPCKKVIVIAGNHDFWFERMGEVKIFNQIKNNVKLKDKLIYLVNKFVVIDGIKIYGCPWCTGPHGWAFVDETGGRYKEIPVCDILLTHQPPKVKKLGCSYPGMAYERDFGSEQLRDKIFEKQPKFNFCGHIHSGIHGGVTVDDCKTVFYNVSIKDEDYKTIYKPTYVEYETGE